MQELLGRLTALDSEASQSLRVIACFDELIVGNVNSRGLLSAAAALAGCAAGFRHVDPDRRMRVNRRGTLLPAGDPGPTPLQTAEVDGLVVWLEREGAPLLNDAIILERLAMALRVRHGRGRAVLDNRRDMVVLLDRTSPVAARREAAGRLGLRPDKRYRVVAAPLFATWIKHPVAPEDVVPSEYGPLHALVIGAATTDYAARPSGTGASADIDQLAHSFRTAVVALRLWTPGCSGTSSVDTYGGLVEMLADLPSDPTSPDVSRIATIVTHPWGEATLEALVQSGSVRQAAKVANVHHSTMQTRLDLLIEELGFDPLDGYGRARLGVAWLTWRLRHSRVLDLPAPVRSVPVA